MKKGILILVLAIFGLTTISFGQKHIESITSVTLEAETATIEATYTNYYDGSKFYSGVVGYLFTITNVADTLQNLYLEGGYDGVNYVLLDSIAVYVDGTYNLSSSPPEFQKYRLNGTTATGDTVTLENITYYEKIPIVK